MPNSWIDREDGLAGAFRELGRLKRRAAARPILTLGITLLVTGMVVNKQARKATDFSSHVTFRIVEGDVDSETAMAPNRALRSYVATVVFSNERLIDLMKVRKLRGGKLKRSASEAAEELREDIHIKVWRNYFLWAREVTDPARSARLLIGYHDKDPQVAYDVVKDLADILLDHEEQLRTAQAEATAQSYAQTLELARADVDRARREIADREAQLESARPVERAQLELEVKRLRGSLEGLQMRVETFEKRRTQFELRAGMEREKLGLRFEVVEPPILQRPRPRDVSSLVILALVLFAIVLPLVGIAVGAFDPRVYDTTDVRRLGWEPLGHVESFAGDGVGSLEERLRRQSEVD